MHDGYKLWRTTARLADSKTVYAGADDGTNGDALYPAPVAVHVGDVVSFVNNGWVPRTPSPLVLNPPMC